ncbi:MAG: hypothetical protein HQM14_12155 [SAR324 cluster bacterium]|nr:hypothetical protein [SAR324 cluster bacterium]
MLEIKHYWRVLLGGWIVGMLCIGCTTSNPVEKTKSLLYELCLSRKDTRQETKISDLSRCQRWESLVQRAKRMQEYQEDLVLAMEGLVRHLNMHPADEEALSLLTQIRIARVDALMLEIDGALQQKDHYRVWKWFKELEHIEKLVRKHAPIPAHVIFYVRSSPLVQQAVTIVESELNPAFKRIEKNEEIPPLKWNYRGNTLVTVCYADTHHFMGDLSNQICIPVKLNPTVSPVNEGLFFQGFSTSVELICQYDKNRCVRENHP